MIQLGLKSGTTERQVKDRLQYQPDVFEFYTNENDFTVEGLKRLTYDIEWVKDEATNKIVLHHPMKFRGVATELAAPEDRCPDLYAFVEQSSLDLLQIAAEQNVQVLIHGAYARQTEQFIAMYPNLATANKAVFKRLDHFQKLGGQHVMFENSISRLFAYGDPTQEKEILSHQYRLAYDTSHCFIKTRGSNEALDASLKNLHDQIVHYHLVDSMGQHHDSLPLGKGKISWQQVVPLLNPQATNIFEIQLADENHALEQVESFKYLQSLSD
ncbi:xylose isomerase [Ligilactobacillus salitolerans]|uniref:Xylose isomerase n=1 Tax=Ligilactobacillus salitolerans TaxID=1808352 RepID=A0A401ITP7_9LACO|nr:TIM barrel protein [Ligilactobacillus salitolerans]GBG94888.1 xylose isomerase [Ligilactobacillus salitolerans]